MNALLSMFVAACLWIIAIEATQCENRKSPFHGKMTCSRGGEENSRCTFSCRTGYRLRGPANVKCSEGQWSSPFPYCQWIQQCRVLFRRPSNGRIACTNNQYQGSQCSFRCNSGYEMRGSPTTTCMGPGWSQPPPVCTPKRTTCMSKSTTLHNGFKGCTGNSIGSACYYVCKPGFNLVGSRKSTCRETSEGGQWSVPPPVCVEETRRSCPTRLQAPENGYFSCSHENFLGSQCYFECELGYRLIGKRMSSCSTRQGDSSPRWSSPSPRCVQVKAQQNACTETSDKLRNGYKGCTDTNEVGSKCYHVCKRGYTMIGKSKVTCVETNDGCVWNAPSPICMKSGTCPSLVAPQNGHISCSNGKNKHNSECHFECSVGYDLVGSDSTTCVEDEQTGQTTWSSPAPLCIKIAEACESSKRSDVVLALDSSVSYGSENWRSAKEFARKFINSFIMSGDSTRFSVIQYNEFVQTESQILLKDFQNDRKSLIGAFNKLPNELGFGLSTGRALQYIKDVILKEENGDRPDVRNIVVLFTGSKSNDDVSNAAQQLREETGDTTVYVVGINPVEGRWNADESLVITGSIQQSFFAEEGFFGVDKALSNHLDDSVCRIQSED